MECFNFKCARECNDDKYKMALCLKRQTKEQAEFTKTIKNEWQCGSCYSKMTPARLKKRVRRGVLYRKIMRCVPEKSARLEAFSILKKQLGGSRLDYYIYKVASILKLFIKTHAKNERKNCKKLIV